MLARNQEAIHLHLAYPEFLELLVEDDLATQRGRLFACLLKQASIIVVKSLDGHGWFFNPQAPGGPILDPATALTVAAIQAGHTTFYARL